MTKYLLITGQIAEHSLRKVTGKIPGAELEVKALPCTVAALMTTEFIARELKKGMAAREVSLHPTDTIIIPGLSQGRVDPIREVTQCEVRKGPKDLKDLPAFLDPKREHKIPAVKVEPSPLKIVAEIVDASRRTLREIIARAEYFRMNGADIIDLGGELDRPFPNLQETIEELKREGFQVSIDSHREDDIREAGRAGVDLVLSLKSSNLHLAKGLDCPVVLIPDDWEDLNSLYKCMDTMEKWQKSYLADPILPPLTMGLAAGIGRYLQVRQEFPHCEMLMGLGNVTELLDADSVGINALLTGVAAELRINYILTTEVSKRARGSIREISLARDLIHQAMTEERIPKHINNQLLTIKEAAGNEFEAEDLYQMHKVIKDRNYRIFVADLIYIFNNRVFLAGKSAKELFYQLAEMDAKHAFYLGRELEKAELALVLGKKYTQDNPLHWGYLSEITDRGGGCLP
ncbi:DUF6513 domain-containing protein [Desulfosporosinus lacus]|uniref:Dihydropteroate synthase-related protein n=1 Tax=Desulfosporosinus lacus DSM 15449 TaxID=1121420 RepID=A0A1M5V5J9_9FIRM|nr:DUF6513 domain-containing protein [Desulfosporosinus lacus]SHH70384.1 dihydropteroate synthase-related protein [Desulfosporosinus lacus DSM 15449]